MSRTNSRGWPCGTCEYIGTGPADLAAHVRGYHPADPRGVTADDHASLAVRHRAEERLDGGAITMPARSGGRIVCHGCGARVFNYATAASGRNYCPTCRTRIVEAATADHKANCAAFDRMIATDRWPKETT